MLRHFCAGLIEDAWINLHDILCAHKRGKAREEEEEEREVREEVCARWGTRIAYGGSMYLNCRWSPQKSSLRETVGVAGIRRVRRDIEKKKEKEREAGPEEQRVPSGGSRSVSSLSFSSPFFLPVGRRSRALFSLLLAGGDRRKGTHEKKETDARARARAQEPRSVWKTHSRRGKFRGKGAKAPRPTRVRASRCIPARFCVYTREIACLWRRTWRSSRILQLTLGASASLAFSERNSRRRLTLYCTKLPILTRDQRRRFRGSKKDKASEIRKNVRSATSHKERAVTSKSDNALLYIRRVTNHNNG